MAVQRKNSGKYNCAQAVTTALADQTGLQEEQLKQISAGFCAGMGNMQATCGALIGAGMIAGLKTEGKGTLKATRQVQEAFRGLRGQYAARDLKAVTDGKPPLPLRGMRQKYRVLIYGRVMGLE